MNTVKSFWIGWGSLCLAGGGAYYFAKKSINADRQARFEAEQKKRRLAESLEYSYNMPKQPASTGSTGLPSLDIKEKRSENGGAPQQDHFNSPSQEASLDPAPTRHAPESEGQRVREKSKYEASEPFRAKKGDRFT